MKTCLFFLIVIGFLLIPESSGLTQITPDNTLPNHSVVTPKGTTFVIEEGTQKGNNLFHSFQEFSVPTGFGALFNNGLTIENIFSRVTGNSASFIDGMLSANGTANLFFLNPNGIIFGPNASLNLGGSFLATTASSFKFADEKQYSAITPNYSILTDSSPVGLNFNANSGLIVVQGSGYNILEIPPLSPFIVGQHRGLKVSPGKTLALVGGNVSLEGGVLNAEAGRIELGAVEQGTVNFKPIPQGWKFDYSGTTNFGNINIGKLALVDASGLIGGSVQLYGKQITIDGGGLVLIRNFGNQPSGDIFVKATDTFKIAGNVINSNSPSPLAVGRSSITTESLTQGKGGDIIVSTNNLIIQDGGVIGARGFGNAAAGNITLGVNDNIQLLDFSAINPRFFSGVSSVTVGSGNSGDVSVSARNLLATNGGEISASTLGSGNGGKIQVNVKDSIQLIGVIPNVLLPSSIGTSTLSSGDGGTLIIDTSRLIVRDGARIDTSSYSSGLAGNIVINASELVEVSGSVPGSINPAIIGSAVDRVDPVLQALFGLPQIPTGASGNITINSPQLVVKDNALVAVRNTGIGNAGNLTLNVPLITVENSGAINAATFSGEGGNITINSNDLRLLNNGEISATAGGSGNGGNININTDIAIRNEM